MPGSSSDPSTVGWKRLVALPAPSHSTATLWGQHWPVISKLTTLLSLSAIESI